MVGLLNTQEREELVTEVANLVFGEIRNLMAVIPMTHVIQINTNSNPSEYAFNVIRYCELAAWVEDPALIIKLLTHFNYLPTFDAAIHRLKASTPLKFYQGNRVWDTFLLALHLPFLNRLATREAIECFSYPLIPTIKPAGVRVLIVKGPKQSGKSYTLQYIRYVNSVFASLNFNSVWVDFKKQMSVRFGPAELVASLLDQINPNWKKEVSLPVLDAQQPARWIQELVGTLVGQIRNLAATNIPGAHLLIILDGFDDIKVPTETKDLIQFLAAVATGQYLIDETGDIIRLVILGFEETISNYRSRVKIDDIKPIDEADLAAYFTSYANYKERLLEPDSVKALVDKIGLPNIPDTPERTSTIARAALIIAHAVFEEQTIAEGGVEITG